MRPKTVLAISLVIILLADYLNCLKWQGTGIGTNNTVLAEIWSNLENNLNTALTTNDSDGYNTFSKDISDRLNNRWDTAWNVVLTITLSQYDTVLYGYAFRDQWMWFNGVPNSVLSSEKIATLIVWKDYNCKDWRYFGNSETGFSAFSSTQGYYLYDYLTQISDSDLKTNIWNIAHNIISYIQNSVDYPGAYTTIMNPDGSSIAYGYVCRVGDNFANYLQFTSVQSGAFYMFQTRQ